MKGKLFEKSSVYLKKNAPTILTCVGGAGVIATSVLTATGTIKALDILEETKKEHGEELTKLELIKAVAPAYIPAIASGVFTLSCIFGANVLNKRRQASMAGAYALLATKFKDYKSKVEDIYGEGTNAMLRKEIADEHYKEDEFVIDPNKELFYDMYSGRYFESTMADVIQAEYHVNHDASIYGGSSLNHFYAAVGLDERVEYEELGWNAAQVYDMSWHAWIEFKHEKVELEDGMECWIITMLTEPTMDYLDY